VLQFLRYNLVGIVNTLVGFSIVFGLMLMGLSPSLSNLLGYGVGMVVSFVLNRRYTFKSTHHNPKEIIGFVGVMLLSYGFNFATLQLLLHQTNPYLAQLLSAVVYTVSSFLMLKFLVFKAIP